MIGEAEQWVEIGVVPVDAGCSIITDPCTLKALPVDEWWERALQAGLIGQVDDSTVISPSGLGDGAYPG